MNTHSRSRTTAYSRALMLCRVWGQGWTVRQAAEAAGVSERTFYKWQRRFEEDGWSGLMDRPSRPRRSPRRTPQTLTKRILRLRKRKLSGLLISQIVHVSRSTVSRVLRAAKLSRARDLEPRRPIVRYEKEAPGELLHLDTKKLARFKEMGHRVLGDVARGRNKLGWEYAHVCVDDHTRLAYVEVLPKETAEMAAGFLDRAVAWFQKLGVRVQGVLTDNGGCYKSGLFRDLTTRLGIRQSFTRPFRPQTNGKAERFIQTALREWAYGLPYPSSKRRTRALGPWLHYYNGHRPHYGIGAMPPVTRLPNSLNNVLAHNT